MLRKLMASLVLVGLAAATTWAFLFLNRPVRVVEVVGELEPGEAAEVRRRISAAAPGRLLSTNLNTLRQQVLALSWPRTVSIRRVWPDTIAVLIEPEALVAQWSDQGYLSGAGELVGTPAQPASVPYLECEIASPKEALETYRHLQEIASREGLAIAALNENALGEWRLRLTDGVQATLGNASLHDRMHRFLAVHRHLSQGGHAALRHVDLRYANGVAVRAGEAPNLKLLANR